MSAQEPPAHVQALTRVHRQLVESMRRVDRLVAALYQARHLSDQERQRINSQPTMFDRADQLLGALCKKPSEPYQCFLEALISTNQAHLRDLLAGAGTIRKTVLLLLDAGINVEKQNKNRWRRITAINTN